MDRNWRNEDGPHNEHTGYNESDYSSGNHRGGAGRSRGNNYGRSGGSSYYGPGYDDSSYEGGRRDRGYARDEWERNRYDDYREGDRGYDPYSEYERDQRSRFSGRNEQGTRRGSQEHGRRGDTRDERDHYGPSDRSWSPSSWTEPGNYGARAGYPGNEDDRGYDSRYGRNTRPYNESNSDHRDYGASRSGDRPRNQYDDMYGSQAYGHNQDWPYSHGATRGGGMNDSYGSRSGSEDYRSRSGRSSEESGHDKDSSGQGRGSRGTRSSSSRGEMPGGTNVPFTDPWL